MKRLSFAGLLLLVFAAGASAQDRMPPLPAARLTDAQKKALAEFTANRKTEPFGPFIAWMRSPEVMTRAMAMGDYLRFKSSLGNKLSEFVILMISRDWTAQYEWHVHEPLARQAGLDPQIMAAIKDGRRPERMGEDEQAVYDFCTELIHNQYVSDPTYARALARFGEQGIIDMVGIAGYYVFVAMTLNTVRLPLPPGASPQLPALP